MYCEYGFFRTPERMFFRGIFWGIVARCEYPTNRQFPDYGGRGIRLHPEWRNDPGQFLDYIGPRPSPKHVIDRINNDGNYEPGNVRWATPKESAANRRNTPRITYRGIERPLEEWARLFYIPHEHLYRRIVQYGWTPERAFAQKPKVRKHFVTFEGKTQSIVEWAQEKGFNHETLAKRLKRYPLADAMNLDYRPLPFSSRRKAISEARV